MRSVSARLVLMKGGGDLNTYWLGRPPGGTMQMLLAPMELTGKEEDGEGRARGGREREKREGRKTWSEVGTEPCYDSYDVDCLHFFILTSIFFLFLMQRWMWQQSHNVFFSSTYSQSEEWFHNLSYHISSIHIHLYTCTSLALSLFGRDSLKPQSVTNSSRSHLQPGCYLSRAWHLCIHICITQATTLSPNICALFFLPNWTTIQLEEAVRQPWCMNLASSECSHNSLGRKNLPVSLSKSPMYLQGDCQYITSCRCH